MTSIASARDLLVGEWRGRGVADFPTIDRVEYDEELDIVWEPAARVFAYEQRAVWDGGSSTHRESGFIRLEPSGGAAWWNAQSNGRTEVLGGSSAFDDRTGELRIEVVSVEFGNDPRMLGSARVLSVQVGAIRYETRMATTTTAEPELLMHLAAALSPVPPEGGRP